MRQIYLFLLSAILALGATFQAKADDEITTLKVTYTAGLKGCVTKHFIDANLLNTETGVKWAMTDPVQDVYTFKNVAGKQFVFYVAPNGYDIQKVVKKVPGKADEELTKAGSALSPYYRFYTVAGETDIEIAFIGPDASEIQTRDVVIYTNNAEGLTLSTAVGGEALDLGAGEDGTASITLKSQGHGNLTWEAGDYKKYTIPVNSTLDKLFWAPKDGYYIYTAYGSNKTDKNQSSNPYSALIDSETPLYFDVRKIERNNTLKINYKHGEKVDGIPYTKIVTAKEIDPELKEEYILTDETSEIKFDTTLDLPMSLRFIVDPDEVQDGSGTSVKYVNFGVFLNGVEIEPDDNGNHTLSVKDGDELAVYEKVPKVSLTFESDIVGPTYAFGEDAAKDIFSMSGFQIKTKEQEYKIFPDRKVTLDAVKEDVTIKVDGATVEATDGKYTFTPTADTAIQFSYTGTKNKPVVTPAAGTIDNLDEFTISFPEATQVNFKNALDKAILDTDICIKSVDNEYGQITYTISRVDAKTFKFTHNAGSATVAPTKYMFIIGAGLFSIDGEMLNIDCDTQYEIENKLGTDYMIEPSKNLVYQYPGYKSVMANIVFEEGSTVTLNPRIAEMGPVLTYAQNMEGAGMKELQYCDMEAMNKDWTIMIEKNIVTIGTLTDSWINDGILLLYLPEGAFTVNGQPSPEIEQIWTLVDHFIPEIEHTVVADPADGSTVAGLSQIVFSFPNDTYVEVIGGTMPFKVKKNGTLLDAYSWYTITTDLKSEVPTVTLKFKKALAPAEYTVIINDADDYGRYLVFDQLGNDVLPRTEFHYTLKNFNHAVTNETGSTVGAGEIKDLSKIYIVFNDIETAELKNENGIHLKSSDGTYHEFASIKKVEAAPAAYRNTRAGQTHTFEVAFASAPQAQGAYTLTIEPGTFELEGASYPVAATTTAYDLIPTGIMEIAGDAAGVTVITIDGKVLLNNGDASELNSLQPGLYIINGKKVVKK